MNWGLRIADTDSGRVLAMNRSCRLRIATGLIALCAAITLSAATNDPVNPDEIPPLRPPKPEILPGYWERHGLLISLAGVGLLIAVIVLWRILSRPTPPVLPSPAAVAREALTPLRQSPEDPTLLTEVSSILRRYFIAAFVLPEEELTNHELCQRLKAHPKVGSELASAAAVLLVAMDHQRFNAEAEQPLDVTEDTDNRGQAGRRPHVVEEALRLIALAEKQLQQPVETELVRLKS